MSMAPTGSAPPSWLALVAQKLDVPTFLRLGHREHPAERELRLARGETIELVRSYYAIPDERVRRRFLVELVKAASKMSKGDDLPPSLEESPPSA
jgi:hypothetical protein